MTTTTAAPVDATALSGLRARFRGALLRPEERATRRRGGSGTAPSTGTRR